MADNTENVASDHSMKKFHEEVYEQLWTIPDWDRIHRSQETLTAQTFEFTTGKSTKVLTKWTMGFQLKPSPNYFNIYWKLIEAKGFPDSKVDVTSVWTLLKGDSTAELTDTQKNIVNIGETVEVQREFSFRSSSSNYWGVNINPNGELVCKLKLTIMEPVVPPVELKMKRFHKACVMQLGVNLAALIGDKATADLKIITSDEKELLAHKLILKAQCPVFESMFRSDLSENQTGIVNVKDVCSKTMEIFLHFFYSGELRPSWKDQDTVVEFTYAVGKYQLTNVLKMLDDVLGSRDEKNATYTDVQLLDLAQKLNLKTAEKELMERIRRTLGKVNTGPEFLALWGNGKE